MKFNVKVRRTNSYEYDIEVDGKDCDNDVIKAMDLAKKELEDKLDLCIDGLLPLPKINQGKWVAVKITTSK